MPMKIKNALISLSDKNELDKLLKILQKFKINIISSGGTFREIKKLGYSFDLYIKQDKTCHYPYAITLDFLG